MDANTAIKNLSGGITASQKKLLDNIKDPEQKALQQLQMEEQNKALVSSVITNILKMKHDEKMEVARNLK